MEGYKRNNDLTKEQIKGIDLSVKSVSKKFSFVKGWEFSEDYDKYVSHLYINILIDIFEVAELLKYQVKDYYINNLESVQSSALSPFLKIKDSSDYTNDEQVFEDAYSLGRDVDNALNYFYDILPEKFKLYYSYEGIFGKTDSIVILKVNKFIHLKK